LTLFAHIRLDDFAQIPQTYHLLLSFTLLFLSGILHINSMGAAIGALYLNIPTAFVNKEAATTANWTILKNYIRVYFHNCSLLLI
jgi:hypothetical protein